MSVSPATTASNCGSNRLPITEAACSSARSFGARRSTRAVRTPCTLAGSAAATALASKSNLPAAVRSMPRSVRKLTISSANSGLPSAFSVTCRASASGKASTPSRACTKWRMSPVGSGSRGNLVTIARSSQGGAYSGRRVVRSRSLSFASLSMILPSNSSDTLSIQCKSSITMTTGERRQRASSNCCNSSRVRRPISTTVKPRQSTVGDFEAEQVEQQADVPQRVEAECGQPHLQLLRDVLLGFARADAERATHHFDEGQERCLLAVGRAASRQDKGALLADALAELVEQARLAHARLGNQIDDAELRTGLVQSALQHLQFAFASDKRAEAPAYRCLKPGSPLANGIEPIDFLRLGLALDLMVASEGRPRPSPAPDGASPHS